MEISWNALHESIASCENCALCREIHHKVPGQGAADARLMLIGEGPGAEEDLQGLAFVGPAGQLLTRMLAAIGLTREQVYICNVVKCRPPQNRNPEPDEAAACINYLRAQVALVRPRVIVLLGKVACRYTLGEELSVMRVHGQWYERKGVYFMPTFHPSFLLRDPGMKRAAWDDFQKIRDKLNEIKAGE